MIFREAQLSDIPELTRVRLAVRENVLSTPGRITPADYADYLTRRGRGWLAETPEGRVAGFAIADLLDHSVWALFVHPDHDRQGIGKRLHGLMLDWYFGQTRETVWLSTGPGTRAEEFYRRQGWQEAGRTGSGEVRFELTVEQWWIKSTSSQLYLLANRVAQAQLPIEAAIAWFEALNPDYQQWALSQLQIYVHQAHPTAEALQETLATASIKPGATPLVLLRTFPLNVALSKVVSLRADEHRNAFVVLLTLFRLADTYRRNTYCKEGCSHDWHNLPALS